MVTSLMAPVHLSLLALLILTSLVRAVPLSIKDLLPEDPSKDPFYEAPEGFESKAPGTVLRTRTVHASYLGIVPNPTEVHQLLYRTTAINGSAITTATTIFKPADAKLDRFVSFHTAYDASSVTCNPSYQYQLGASQTDAVIQVEELIIQFYLAQGYIVASPDYEGPDAAFAAGRLEGMCVVDGIRAVLNYHAALNLSEDAMVVGSGYSGGAIATGWAASVQPTYAPELGRNIKGWAAGGTPANITGTLLYIDNGVFSGFIPAAIDGMSAPSAFGEYLAPVIEHIVTPEGQKKLDLAKGQCTVADLFTFMDQSLFVPAIQDLGPSLLQNRTVSDVLSRDTMGVARNETPTAPVFMYHATPDEIIPYDNAHALADSWCGFGADAHLTSFEAGGHFSTELLGLPRVLDFVASAFAGDVAGGCSRISTLTHSLEPLELGLGLEPLLVKAIDLLVKFGRKDENVAKDLNVLNKLFD